MAASLSLSSLSRQQYEMNPEVDANNQAEARLAVCVGNVTVFP